MELEVSAEAKDKSLNRRIAITVVILSVFTGLANIKDGNIVQNMALAQSNSVDRWNEYQAAKTKGHIAEVARTTIGTLAEHPSPAQQAALMQLDGEIAKYRSEGPGLSRQAKDFAAQYDALNVHDDQFDASDAAIATAISMAAVAALAESEMLLVAAWVFGGFGLFMGLCGFLGWSFHPDILSNFLG